MGWISFSSPPPPPPTPEAIALPFLEGFIAFSVIVWAFEFYLDVRQRRQLGIKEVPGRLQSVISPAEFEAARQYSIDKLSFKMLEDSVGTFKTIGAGNLSVRTKGKQGGNVPSPCILGAEAETGHESELLATAPFSPGACAPTIAAAVADCDCLDPAQPFT